jgi:hypothetical protein
VPVSLKPNKTQHLLPGQVSPQYSRERRMGDESSEIFSIEYNRDGRGDGDTPARKRDCGFITLKGTNRHGNLQ